MAERDSARCCWNPDMSTCAWVSASLVAVLSARAHWASLAKPPPGRAGAGGAPSRAAQVTQPLLGDGQVDDKLTGRFIYLRTELIAEALQFAGHLVDLRASIGELCIDRSELRFSVLYPARYGPECGCGQRHIRAVADRQLTGRHLVGRFALPDRYLAITEPSGSLLRLLAEELRLSQRHARHAGPTGLPYQTGPCVPS